MKEQILKLIERNNAVVDEIKRHGEVKIAPSALFALMEINHVFTCESSEIVKMARASGIDAKYNAQTGRITVYGDIKEEN